MRTVLKKLTIVLASTLVLVLGGEVLCRLVIPSELDKEVAQKLPSSKPDGTFRVFTVGGSSVAGLPIKEYGFVRQLEELLRHLRPDQPLEVVNFGRGGRPSKAVRGLVERIVDEDPDLIVVYTGHNEFLFRSGDSAQKRLFAWLQQNSALYRTGNKALTKLRGPEERPEYILPKQLRPYDRNTEWWDERKRGYAENIEAMIEACSSRGIPMILGTVASNDIDWPPVYKALAEAKSNPDYDADVAAIQALLEEDRTAALKLCEEVIAEHGDDAMTSWLAGRALAGLGSLERAQERFDEARLLDPYPWRAMPEFNGYLRSLAGREGVHLVDVEKLLREHSREGITGFLMISDNCHPTPIASAHIARELAAAMVEAGLFFEGDVTLPLAEESHERFVNALPEAEQKKLRTAYFRENGIYSMKTPFRNYTAAEGWFRRGLEFAPDDWAMWANAGANALLAGDRDLGVERLREASRLAGRPLDPAIDRPRVPYLRQSTHLSGIDLATLGAE